MPNREHFSTMNLAAMLTPAALTATTAATSIDLQGYESATIVASVGAAGITLSGVNNITLQLQESDDNSTFTNVAAADTHNGVGSVLLDANAKAARPYLFSYKGYKRYTRLNIVFAGTHGTGTIIGVNGHRGDAAVNAVPQPHAAV